jgi:hypothetical protein
MYVCYEMNQKASYSNVIVLYTCVSSNFQFQIK